jgi:hypothetical protein
MKNSEAENSATLWLFKWAVSTVSPTSHKYNSGLRLLGKVVKRSRPPGSDGNIRKVLLYTGAQQFASNCHEVKFPSVSWHEKLRPELLST